MQKYSSEVFKRNLILILLSAVSLLSLLSVAFNIRAVQKSSHPLLIAIDENGPRIISGQNDPIYKTEASKFIQRFLLNTYNFEPDTFLKKVGAATSVMSDRLWSSKKNSILDVKAKVERDLISLEAKVLKITKDEQGTYYALLEVKEKNRIQVIDRKIEAKLTIKPVERNETNVWGMEIDSYEESIIRN